MKPRTKETRIERLERERDPEVVITVNWDENPPDPEPGTIVITWDDGNDHEHEDAS